MLIIFGDSHVKALKSGFDLLPDRAAYDGAVKFAPIGPFPRFLTPFFAKTSKGITFTKGSLRRLYLEGTGDEGIDAGTDNTYVFSAPLNPLGLLCNDDWNHFSPPGILDKRRTISTAVMEQIVLQHFNPLTSFLKAFIELNIRCIVVSGPPARFDNVLMARKASVEARRKIDEVCRATMIRTIENLGLAVIPPPKGTFDEYSNLLPQYHHERRTDYHHANSDFGMLLMKDILAHIGATKAVPDRKVATLQK